MTQQIYKALPSTSQVHVDAPLSNIAEKYYLGDQDIFVAGKVFPQVPVAKICLLYTSPSPRDRS